VDQFAKRLAGGVPQSAGGQHGADNHQARPIGAEWIVAKTPVAAGWSIPVTVHWRSSRTPAGWNCFAHAELLEPDQRLQPARCRRYCCEDDLHGQLLHESFRLCLANHKDDWPETLAELGAVYVQEGASKLSERLSRLGRELAAGFEARVYDVHLDWLRLADEFGRCKIRKQSTIVDRRPGGTC
jgi:hypothetical protein